MENNIHEQLFYTMAFPENMFNASEYIELNREIKITNTVMYRGEGADKDTVKNCNNKVFVSPQSIRTA